MLNNLREKVGEGLWLNVHVVRMVCWHRDKMFWAEMIDKDVTAC